MSQPLPLAFCYVPSQQQMQQYFSKKTKPKKQSSTVVTSPVDRTISFFGPRGTCGKARVSDARETGAEGMWSHLLQDKLWKTVLEYYYNLCSVSHEKRSQAMNVYIRRKVKNKSERKESKRCLSYTEIAHKLGILSVKTQTEISKQETENSEEVKGSDLVGSLCATNTASTSGCSSATNCNSTEELSNSDVPANVSYSTLASNSNDSITSDSDQVVMMKQQNVSSNCQSVENSSRKSSFDKDTSRRGSLPDGCSSAYMLSGSNDAKYTNVLVDTEKELMDRLSSSPSSSWSITDDLVLVRCLCDICEKSSQGRSKVRVKIEQVSTRGLIKGAHCHGEIYYATKPMPTATCLTNG